MADMSTAEREAFLDELPARTAVLAVTRKDGRPIRAPIWYVRDGDELVFTTWAQSLKGKALRRDPRIALTVHLPRRSGRVRSARALLVNCLVVAEAASQIRVLLGHARRTLVRARTHSITVYLDDDDRLPARRAGSSRTKRVVATD